MPKELRYILILIALVVGMMLPPVWFFILLLVKQDEDKARQKNTPSSAYTTPYRPSKEVHTDTYVIHESDYMSSKEWNTIRKVTLKRDNYTCQSCGVRDISLDVHHTTYEDFGEEKLDQLVSLCRECHSGIHKRLGYDHSDLFPID